MAQGLRNHNHDLVQQLSEDCDSLWRYEEYIKNAQGQCERCVKLWQDLMEKEKATIKQLRAELENHAIEGNFK